MRSIIQDILAAPMPVIVYVYAERRARGLGRAYITQAADVAAMAPETNIGSATPIAIGPAATASDLSAARSRTTPRRSCGRWPSRMAATPTLAEQLVSQATNLTVAGGPGAPDRRDRAEPGPICSTSSTASRSRGRRRRRCTPADLRDQNHDMPFQYQLLEILVNPTVAYLLLLLGLVGIAIEFFSPGLIAPGTLGVDLAAAGPLRHRPAAGEPSPGCCCSSRRWC